MATRNAGVGPANAQTNEATPTGVVNPNGIPEKLELTPAQRSAIYDAVRKDKSKVAPSRFSTAVGAEVPAFYKYTWCSTGSCWSIRPTCGLSR